MDLTEVRLLGAMRVRRANGTYVGTADWRTSMTRGLLVLLALSAPKPVPAERALEAIWPNVDPEKSRARLRTAASQIRKTIDADCIEREGDSLVLTGVWTDTRAFEQLVGQARRHFMMGQHERGIAAAYEALGLYAGDLFDDGSAEDWITLRREHFRRLHRELLVETAEAALQIGRTRDAVIAAGEVSARYPADERACRVLISGFQRLGETAAAFNAYQTCRTALADMLGADPSDETERAHLSLLSARGTLSAPPRFIGREGMLDTIRGHLATVVNEGNAKLVQVVGPEGSGKSRLLDELGSVLRTRTVLLRSGVTSPDGNSTLVSRIATTLGTDDSLSVDHPTIVCLDDYQWCGPRVRSGLMSRLSGLRAPLLIVAATTTPLPDSVSRDDIHRIRSLRRPQIAELVAQVLQGPIGQEMLTSLIDDSGGLPGPLIRETLRLRDSGMVKTSPAGFSIQSGRQNLVASASAQERVEAARATLGTDALEVLDVMAVLNEEVTQSTFERLGVGAGAVPAAFDSLLDSGLLIREDDRYLFADDDLQSAAYHWLRPSIRRRLHMMLGNDGAGILSHSTRLRQWVAAGSPPHAGDVHDPR